MTRSRPRERETAASTTALRLAASFASHDA
jgi:hypothetical protein